MKKKFEINHRYQQSMNKSIIKKCIGAMTNWAENVYKDAKSCIIMCPEMLVFVDFYNRRSTQGKPAIYTKTEISRKLKVHVNMSLNKKCFPCNFASQ